MANRGPSTSRRNDNAMEFEDLDKEQRLKAALYHGIKQIAKEVEDEMEVRISSQILATLCESLNRQAEIYAVDLELFAKHSKRTNINVDDVKLLARRNQQLLEHLNGIAAEFASEKESKKRPRNTSNKDKSRPKKGSKKGASSTTVFDSDDEN